MKKKYTPYNFDEKYEYRVYSGIGKRYFKKFKGMKIRRSDVKFSKFDKYLEWENYFKEKFVKNDDNDCNFWHYLNKELRMNKIKLELCKNVIVPIYVGEFTCLIAIYQSQRNSMPIPQQVTMLFSAIVLTVIFSFGLISIYNNKVNFYNDCIDVIKDMNICHPK